MIDEEKLNWIEHLEEMRQRLYTVLGALVLASIVGFIFSDPIFHFLTRPIRTFEEKLYFMSPYEAFLVKLKVSFFAGILLSSPVTIMQIWRFVAPGLYRHEKKTVAVAAGWTVFCFLCGIVFAFFVAAPFALRFFLGFQTEDLQPIISVKEYINFFTSFLFIFGVAFVFPVFLLVLVQLGVLTHDQLRKQRKAAVVTVFIAAAVLTPSSDIISQLLLALPLILLFEASLFLARRMEKKRNGCCGGSRP